MRLISPRKRPVLFRRLILFSAIVLLCSPVLFACRNSLLLSNETDDSLINGERILTTEGDEVAFCKDFDVVGRSANLLIRALEEKGINRGVEGLTKRIIVGADDEVLAEQAESLVNARSNHYNDFAILCNGEQVALYGGSAYAVKQGVQLLIDDFYDETKGFLLTDRFEYYYRPNLTLETIGPVSLRNLTIVGEKSTISIANDLADELSIRSGYEVSVSLKETENAIELRVRDPEGHAAFSAEYELTVEEKKVILTAETIAGMTTAVRDFVNWFPKNEDWKEGDVLKRTIPMDLVKASDISLFKYCGMWEQTDPDNPDTMVSYWGGASVEIDYFGMAVDLAFSAPSKCRIQLDGKDLMIKETSVSGIYTVTADTEGKHTIRVYTNDRESHINFAGVYVMESGVLSRTPNKAHYIQFVGDSISDTVSSFSFRSALLLNWDYCVTAVSGIALENNYGFWYLNNGHHNDGTMSAMIRDHFAIRTIGMEDAFFKLGIAEDIMSGTERERYATGYYTEALDCHFNTGYTPDIVFLFLGTNDELISVADAERFTKAYRKLVEGIFRTYGDDTQICILQALSHSGSEPDENHPRFTCIRLAAESLIALYPGRIRFIDRDVILTWNVELSDDYTHPTLNGYNTLTEKIADLLNQYYS